MTAFGRFGLPPRLGYVEIVGEASYYRLQKCILQEEPVIPPPLLLLSVFEAGMDFLISSNTCASFSSNADVVIFRTS